MPNPLLRAEGVALPEEHAARRAQLEALTGVAMPVHGPAGHSGIGGGWKVMPNVGPDLGLWQHLQQRADAVSGIPAELQGAAIRRAEVAEKRALEAEKALAEERKLLPGRALQAVLAALKAASLSGGEVQALIKALDVAGHFHDTQSRVEHVLDDLLHQRLVPGERKALRKALEQAERVPASTNEALGRAIRQR